MEKDVRKESSIPIASRISIVDLAKMSLYWNIRENVHMKTMSQLVSWTFSAMVDVLEANGKGVKGIDSVLDAHKHLQSKGLYQQSLKKRGQSRITAALGIENLRKQGSDPEKHMSTAYSTIHSKHSAEPFNGQVDTGIVSKEELSKLVSIYNKVCQEDEVENKSQSPEEVIQLAKDSGLIAKKVVTNTQDERTVDKEHLDKLSEEEWFEDREKLDRDRVKLEKEETDKMFKAQGLNSML